MTTEALEQRLGEFFQGVFDSDGRPWDAWKKQIALPANQVDELYERAQLDALKIALLTQHEIVLPIGYLFDSPYLQSIFLRYSQTGEESDAFRVLMRDAVRIAHGAASGDTIVSDWRDRFQDWALGKTTDRKQLVYMNALPHDVAIELQREAVDPIKKVEAAMLSQPRSINYPMFLRFCEKIEFRSRGERPFDFEGLVRKHLLGDSSDREHFAAFTTEIAQKVHAIAAAAARADQRLSRSLMNNPERCQELGAPALDRSQYESVADIFAHYHHLAFAGSYSLAGVATRTIPTLPAQARLRLEGELDRVISDMAFEGTVGVFPLERMRFIDILRVRTGDNYIKFDQNLRRIRQAAHADNHEDYVDAVKTHANQVASALALPLGQAALKEVLETAPKVIFAQGDRLSEAVRAAAPQIPSLASRFRGVRSSIAGWQFLRSLAESPAKSVGSEAT